MNKKNSEYNKFKKEARHFYINSLLSRFLKKDTHASRHNSQQNSGPDISTITEHIAFVIDDEVVEIMHCQPKLAAILLSSPKIIQIPDKEYPSIGNKYKDGKFIG
jgi:hypothetical protein